MHVYVVIIKTESLASNKILQIESNKLCRPRSAFDRLNPKVWSNFMCLNFMCS